MSGAAADLVHYRQGGAWVRLPRYIGAQSKQSAQPLEPSMLPQLRRRVAAEISSYRTSGLLSEKELRTVEALWNGMSLRAFAKSEGVTPAAIGHRINRMRVYAYRFWRWWTLKNCNKQRR
jgi:hypothetical protein